MKTKPHSQRIMRGDEYPEHTDSDEMARVARELVNEMTEEQAEEHFKAAMARVYGGRSSEQATVT